MALAALGVCLMTATGRLNAQGQGKLAAPPPVTYLNKVEVYAGLSFQNFQAGQDLPKRMNFGGLDLLGTYWLTHKWGVAGDFRGEAGTTPVLANPYTTRPLVVMYEGMGGVEYRGPKNQHIATGLHALAGIGYGDFNETPLPQNVTVGLYTNRSAPVAAAGGTLDFNATRKWAVRLTPDMFIEHFGTETREFFQISGGVLYRFGSK